MVQHVHRSEFSDAGFAIGTVRGARSWRLLPSGTLTGIHFPAPWGVGENVASCLRYHRITYQPATYYDTEQGGPAPLEHLPTLLPPHPVSDEAHGAPHSFPDCRCGYYGYSDGSDDYHLPAYVSGVIEGYGLTVVGTRGFRASKARIVALVRPPIEYKRDPDRVKRFGAIYGGIPMFNTFEAMVAEFPTYHAEA